MKLHCQICGKNDLDQVFQTNLGHRCRECKKLSDVEAYHVVRRRIAETLAEARVLANQAFRDGKYALQKKYGMMILAMEHKRDTMRAPQIP